MPPSTKVLSLALLCVAAAAVVVRGQKPLFQNPADILQTIKAAGMMGKFEEEMKKMLFEESEKRSGASQPAEQDFDFYKFIQSYVAENRLTVNEKVMLYLMDLAPGDRIHEHLAKLTVVLDRVDEISRRNSKLLDNKVLEIVKRVKSADAVKTSLDKLAEEVRRGDVENAKKDAGNVKNDASVKPEAKAKSEPGVRKDDSVKSESKTSKTPTPTKSSVANLKGYGGPTGAANKYATKATEFLEMMKEHPEKLLNTLIPLIADYDLMSKSSLRTFQMYASMITETEYYVTIIDILINYVEDIANTEFGERFSKMLPHLMEAKDMNQMVEVVYKETDMDLNNFLLQLQNSDIRKKLLDSIAYGLTSTLTFFDGLVRDDLKLTFVNTFLVSQGFPVINNRKLVLSGIKLAEKLTATFSSWEVDFRQYEKVISGQVEEFENEYMAWSKFLTLADQEQVNLVSQFLNDNLAEPIELLWLAHDRIFHREDGPKCAESLLCHLNFRIKSRGSKLKIGFAKAISIFASWAWSLDGKLSNWKLYEAIYNGSNTEDCDLVYMPKEVTTCHIFPWQSTPMSLDFEHLEL